MRFPAVKRCAEPPMRGFRQVPAGGHDASLFLLCGPKEDPMPAALLRCLFPPTAGCTSLGIRLALAAVDRARL